MPTSCSALRDVRMVGAQVDNASGAIRSNAEQLQRCLGRDAVELRRAGAVGQDGGQAVGGDGRIGADAEARMPSGVNLDEEAARMLQFQQSYQAAAKMLQVAQAVFDTLLQATGR